jgi:hypothetical protein
MMKDAIEEYLKDRLELTRALVDGRESPVSVDQIARHLGVLDREYGKDGTDQIHARSITMIGQIFGDDAAPALAQMTIHGLTAVHADILAEQLVESARRRGIRPSRNPTWRDDCNRAWQSMFEARIQELEARATPTPPAAPQLDALVEAAVERAIGARIQVREGPSGLPLPAMHYLAVWKAGVSYLPGDVVTHAGTSWHCGLHTKSKPGTDHTWQMMGKSPKDDRKHAGATI